MGVLLLMGIRRVPDCWVREKVWLMKFARGRRRGIQQLKLSFACTVYYIWQERHFFIFRQSRRTPSAIIQQIVHILQSLGVSL